MSLGNRRSESPRRIRSRKRLSLTSLTTRASATSEPDGSFFNIFMPSTRNKRNSGQSLRVPSRPLVRLAPLQPGLDLSNKLLQTHADYDVASIKDITVYPTSLAMIKANWIFPFTFNCTPQLGPALPEHIEQQLYQQCLSGHLDPRPERLPYMHIGSTALGFRVDFYLVLPHASIASSAPGTGHMSYADLQKLSDHVIRPALESAYPRRQSWPAWMDAKNESHLKPLKSRRRSGRSEALHERMHCEGLAAFWHAIEGRSDKSEVAHLLRDKQLMAYGDVAVHDWQADWRPTWAQFKQLWLDGVDSDWVGPGSKFTIEMSLSFADTAAPAKEYRCRRSAEFPPPPSVTHMPVDVPPRMATPPSVASMPPTADPTSPPPSAPRRCPLAAVSPNVVVRRRNSRTRNSRHSIKMIDPPSMDDVSELTELE